MGNSKIFGFWAKKCPYRGSTPCGRAQGCMPPNMGRRGFGVPQNISFDHNSRFGIFLAINRYWLNSWAHSLSIGTGKRKGYGAKKVQGQTDRHGNLIFGEADSENHAPAIIVQLCVPRFEIKNLHSDINFHYIKISYVGRWVPVPGICFGPGKKGCLPSMLRRKT